MSGQNTTVTGSILHTPCQLNYWAKIRGKSTEEIPNGDGIAISWGAPTTCHPGIIGETHPHLPITLQTPTKMPHARLNGWGGRAMAPTPEHITPEQEPSSTPRGWFDGE